MKKFETEAKLHPEKLISQMGIIYFPLYLQGVESAEANNPEVILNRKKELSDYLLENKMYFNRKNYSTKRAEQVKKLSTVGIFGMNDGRKNGEDVDDGEPIDTLKDTELAQHLCLDLWALYQIQMNINCSNHFFNRNLVLKHLDEYKTYSFSLLPLNPEFAENANEPHLFLGQERKISHENNSDGKTVFISFYLDEGKYISFFMDEFIDSIRESPSSASNKDNDAKPIVEPSTKPIEITMYNPSKIGPKFFSYTNFLDLQTKLNFWMSQNVFLYVDLVTKLNEIESHFKEQNQTIQRYKIVYDKWVADDKTCFLRYMACLFLLGQYLRWWKGPNTDWVYTWNEKHTNKANTFREQMIVELLNELDHVKTLVSAECKITLSELKWIDYSVEKGGFKIGAETLDEIFLLIRKGDFCIADGSDRFIKSSVAYMFYLLLGYSLDNVPTEAMYADFSNKINFVILCKSQFSKVNRNIVPNPKFFTFLPIDSEPNNPKNKTKATGNGKKFQPSMHTDPMGKNYE